MPPSQRHSTKITWQITPKDHLATPYTKSHRQFAQNARPPPQDRNCLATQKEWFYPQTRDGVKNKRRFSKVMLNHNVAKQILKPTHQHQISALIQTIRSQLQLYFGNVTTPLKTSPQNFRKTQLRNPTKTHYKSQLTQRVWIKWLGNNIHINYQNIYNNLTLI